MVKECCEIERNQTENARDERDEERNENGALEHKCSYELLPWDDDPSTRRKDDRNIVRRMLDTKIEKKMRNESR
jgi:hypothetical protein